MLSFAFNANGLNKETNTSGSKSKINFTQYSFSVLLFQNSTGWQGLKYVDCLPWWEVKHPSLKKLYPEYNIKLHLMVRL